jgi:hypothetical protein
LKQDDTPLILESDSKFAIPWDLKNPPAVTGAWTAASINESDIRTLPKLKLLDGPIIEKMLYRITNLFMMVDQS